MRKRPQLLTERARRAKLRQWAGLVTLVAAVALAAAYFAGVYWGAPASLRDTARSTRLAQALTTQSVRNAKLRTRVAFLEQSLALSKQSEAATRQAMFALKARQVQLRRKLDFYQGIVTGGSGEAGVKIAGLQIIPTRLAHEYRFQIVLVHAGEERGKRVSGSCNITISGMLNGERKRLALKDISVHGAGPMDFTLRYFRNLAGTLRLPPGFTPRKVDISISMARSGASVTSSYSWPAFKG